MSGIIPTMDSSVVLLLAIAVIFVLCLLTAFGVAVYSGLLHDILIGAGKPPVGEVTVVYKFARGPYNDCGSLFTETCSLAPKLRCFGVYYDDPKQVASEKLRYAVGSILCEGNKPMDSELIKTFKTHGFKLFTFPAANNAVITSFPYTTTFSLPIAVYRVYPAIFNYIKEKCLDAHPWLEIYHDSVIDYMVPLDHQHDFYLPEALAAEESSTDDAVQSAEGDQS